MLNGFSAPNFNVRYLRAYAIRADSLGIDPLLDYLVPKILEIRSFTTHKVTQDERAAPDLISLREYNRDSFWWHIIAYNQLISFREIVEGLVLKIPNKTELMVLTTDAATRNNFEPEIVYI